MPNSHFKDPTILNILSLVTRIQYLTSKLYHDNFIFGVAAPNFLVKKHLMFLTQKIFKTIHKIPFSPYYMSDKEAGKEDAIKTLELIAF